MREQFVTWFFTITAKILTSRCRGVNFLGENISFRNALRMAEKKGEGGNILLLQFTAGLAPLVVNGCYIFKFNSLDSNMVI